MSFIIDYAPYIDINFLLHEKYFFHYRNESKIVKNHILIKFKLNTKSKYRKIALYIITDEFTTS